MGAKIVGLEVYEVYVDVDEAKTEQTSGWYWMLYPYDEPGLPIGVQIVIDK